MELSKLRHQRNSLLVVGQAGQQHGSRMMQHQGLQKCLWGSPQHLLLLLLLLLLNAHSRQPLLVNAATAPAAADIANTKATAGSASDPMQGTARGRATASSSSGRSQPPVNAAAAPRATSAVVSLPTPDETAAVGLHPSAKDCTLMSLYAAMGASGGSNCGAASSQPLPGSSGSSSDVNRQDARMRQQQLAELQKSNARFKDGLFTNARGESFCVSTAGAAEMAQSNANSAQFASIDDTRELPDIVDPACDDVYAVERDGCPHSQAGGQPADAAKAGFLEDAPQDASPSPSPDPAAGLQDCARKFMRVGTQPRSVAIVLLKWRREYYKSQAQCCQEQNNQPGCDCEWNGRTWDNLLPPKTYSRIFTDECDKGPAVNRAYYDITGGRITFHSKLRIPVPSGYSLLPTAGAATSNDGSTSTSLSSAADDTSSAAAAPPAYVVPSEPVETATSYLDPGGVDVYGWATLNEMRDEAGNCKDWCGDAIKQLGVNASEYNHVVCFQHLSSPAICDTCTTGACIGTCPAESGITTGCGCGTCYYAWGMQSGCSDPAAPGANVGIGGWHGAYTGSMAEAAGGPFLPMTAAMRMYLAHELGHNLGLTHTGAIQCTFNADDGTIIREPSQCKPDWYGDKTSFMGGGGTLQLPAAIRYKVRWLPRSTLRTHTLGTERRWLLRPVTIRRPSWQTGKRVRWFGNSTSTADALAVRIPLQSPSDGRANTSSYSCPCNPMPDGDAAGAGACPSCAESLAKDSPNMCKDAPCCLDPKCADKGLNWYYVELHMPFRNDDHATVRGLAVRMMGELASNSCTSTRAVPTHVDGGQLRYLLDQPDPSGEKRGSKFVDALRGVTIVLETWTNTSAIVRIVA